MFPSETLKLEGNKIYCFPWDQSLSDLLYSTKRKTCNGNRNGSRQSTFAGNSALLPAQRLLGETVLLLGVM